MHKFFIALLIGLLAVSERTCGMNGVVEIPKSSIVYTAGGIAIGGLAMMIFNKFRAVQSMSISRFSDLATLTGYTGYSLSAMCIGGSLLNLYVGTPTNNGTEYYVMGAGVLGIIGTYYLTQNALIRGIEHTQSSAPSSTPPTNQ